MTHTPAPPPLSRFRRAGNFVFTSGQLPRGPDGAIVAGDIVAQTKQAFANLEAVLAEAGAALDQVVKVSAWLTDAAHIAGFNAAYREIFRLDFPARTTVVSGLVAGDVEIEAVAYLG